VSGEEYNHTLDTMGGQGDKKVIAVIGSTGKQGGALTKSILSDRDGEFAVRALTRNPEKASKLKDAGAEVVAFDIDNPETHGPAFQGAYGLFVVTNFWEHFDPNKEADQAKAIADSAKEAGISHIIWSTLEATTEFFDSMAEDRPPKIGEWYVPHFDGKALADKFFPADKTTFLYTSFYLDNLLSMTQNGTLCTNMGSALLPVVGTEDIGKIAHNIFKAGDKFKGEKVYAVGDIVTCTDMMKIVSEVTGVSFSYVPVNRTEYAALGFPGAADLANMYDFYVRCPEYVENRDVARVKEISPTTMNVREWAELHKEELKKVVSSE